MGWVRENQQITVKKHGRTNTIKPEAARRGNWHQTALAVVRAVVTRDGSSGETVTFTRENHQIYKMEVVEGTQEESRGFARNK